MTLADKVARLLEGWKTLEGELSGGILDIFGEGTTVKDDFCCELTRTGGEPTFVDPNLSIGFKRRRQSYDLDGSLCFVPKTGAFSVEIGRAFPDDHYDSTLGLAPEGEYVLSGNFLTPYRHGCRDFRLLEIPQPNHVMMKFIRVREGEHVEILPAEGCGLFVGGPFSVVAISAPLLARIGKITRATVPAMVATGGYAKGLQPYKLFYVEKERRWYSFDIVTHNNRLMPKIDETFIGQCVQNVSLSGIPITGEDFSNVPLYMHPEIGITSDSYNVKTEKGTHRQDDRIKVYRRLSGEMGAEEFLSAIEGGKGILDLAKY